MNIFLRDIPFSSVMGIYTVGGVKNRLAHRMLFLHPRAAEHFVRIQDFVVVSDMYRSAESSLVAIADNRGALPPGFSGHGYGLSIDLDIYATLKLGKFASKKALDEFMEKHGFYCYRRDHLITSLKKESHHFNFFGVDLSMFGPRATKTISPRVKTTTGYLEKLIQQLYGHELKLAPIQAQDALKKLGFYGGKLDGKFGPVSKMALRVFRRGWGLGDSDTLDAKTQRTLAFIAAEKVFR